MAFLMVCVFALMVVYRIVDIQYFSNQEWMERASQRYLKLGEVPAPRGNIYAADGSLLLTSLPFYRVAFDPSRSVNEDPRNSRRVIFEEGIQALCDSLSGFFQDESPRYYRERIERARLDSSQYLLLSRKLITHEEKLRMMRWPIFRAGQMKGGIIFERVEERHRPFGYLARRTIGVEDTVRDKQYGLEHTFNGVLAGQPGKALFSRLPGGFWKPLKDQNELDPVDGLDIHTTLDVSMQEVVETALMDAMKTHMAHKGTVVLMEVATGEIKAMASLTAEKKKGELTGKYWEGLNYAVGESTAPGSTFKLASLMAILEEAKGLGLDDTIHVGTGIHKFYDKEMKDDHTYEDGEGVLTIQQVLEKSSNVGVARLADRYFSSDAGGQERFYAYLAKAGLTRPLGVQLAGEGQPKIKNPSNPDERWSGVTLPWMSIGYELDLTPLQVLALYNGVANDGKVLQPLLVRKVSKGGQSINNYEAKVISPKMCSQETLQKLRVCLEGVVERGTAKGIRSEAYGIAGKTGTAKILENGEYIQEYYTSFAGFFPATNPRYSMIVAIERPQSEKKYGSAVAAPVFREIADKIFLLDPVLVAQFPETSKKLRLQAGRGHIKDLMAVAQSVGLDVDSSVVRLGPTFVSASQSSKGKVKMKPLTFDRNKVPDVQGMTLRDALPILEGLGLKVEVSGNKLGKVKRQSQQPDVLLLPGSVMRLYME